MCCSWLISMLLDYVYPKDKNFRSNNYLTKQNNPISASVDHLVISMVWYIFKKFTFTGTVSRDGFGFWGHAWSVLDQNRGCDQFLNLLGASWFFNAKSVFLAVNASLHLLNVSGVYLIQVPLLLIGQQGLGHFIRFRPLLPIGWRIVQILRQRRRKTTNICSANHS